MNSQIMNTRNFRSRRTPSQLLEIDDFPPTKIPSWSHRQPDLEADVIPAKPAVSCILYLPQSRPPHSRVQPRIEELPGEGSIQWGFKVSKSAPKVSAVFERCSHVTSSRPLLLCASSNFRLQCRSPTRNDIFHEPRQWAEFYPGSALADVAHRRAQSEIEVVAGFTGSRLMCRSWKADSSQKCTLSDRSGNFRWAA